IDYLVEKYNVDIADVKVNAARVFPDPELSVSYANNQNWNLQMGYGFDAELNWTLELGGKRKARIRLAQSEKEMTAALLDDYFRNLRAEAAVAYLTALKQKRLLEIRTSSYRQMLGLAHADSLRFRAGAITEVDARQSKLEAAIMLNDVYAGEGDLQDALRQLLLFQGAKDVELPDSIAGELSYSKREYSLSDLITAAQNNRADLQAALKSKEVSQNNLRLAKANRMIDIGISIGGNYSSEVRNEIAPAPAFKGVTAGISIPLKFSNANKGELRAAQLAASQNEMQYQSVERHIAAEVTRSYSKYQIACRQMEQFNAGMLNEAKTILAKKMYGYERGETNLLDVLNAHRSYNEVLINYIETLYNCAAALVELKRACGSSD
ncbi:MAG: TolC family protein, partial [Tannerella sp.]|nr:TolC family protein [Tannerella sp.]